MARRFEAQNLKVISCALNPGNIQSDLARHTNSILALLMKWFIWHPTAMGAITALWAGTADEGVRLNGKVSIWMTSVKCRHPTGWKHAAGWE
jgi:hypothetical protein